MWGFVKRLPPFVFTRGLGLTHRGTRGRRIPRPRRHKIRRVWGAHFNTVMPCGVTVVLIQSGIYENV